MYNYGIVGAGCQGKAIAYDLGVFGDAEKIILWDRELSISKIAADKVNGLLKIKLCEARQMDVSDVESMSREFDGFDTIISAVPYFYNLGVTKASIKAGANMIDLGGNTDVVLSQLNLNDEAEKSGVCVIPDCGLMPGIGNTMVRYAVDKFDSVDTVKLRCGGIPEKPCGMFKYRQVFSLDGLINEYSGEAVILKDGKVNKVDTLSGLEFMSDEVLGDLEAAVTSGGVSTAPWSFEGKVKNLDYKTLRYKGHYEKLSFLKELGFFSTEEIDVNGQKIIPREVLKKLIFPHIDYPDVKDIIVLYMFAEGMMNGKKSLMTIRMFDREDEKTGFTAMERGTAYPASTTAIIITKGDYKGCVSLEKAISGDIFFKEFEKRDIELKIDVCEIV
ncbi:saccharopine dehydrogenase NADP-binding domain-containing protein [bacterium]|nr:saccharopine dehydrogenase NADP-binding domain-containing protein [bacterium]